MRWAWYLVVPAGAAAFSLVVAAVYVLRGGAWSDAPSAGFRHRAAVAGPVPGRVDVVTAGLGEELGWRGFALPRMLRRFTALPASLVLGVLWAGWHLRLLWTQGSALDATPVRLLFLDLPVKAVLFTWIFLRTRAACCWSRCCTGRPISSWSLPVPASPAI